jgi:glycosyltransferase involved in cell wall biosynthesis
MKVLYIHQYFITPDEPGGTRSYWISKELVKRGHRVTVITAARKGLDLGDRDIDGMHVIAVKNKYNNYMSATRKVWSFVNFIRQAIREAQKVKDVDIVYATSTPLTVGYIAMRLKKKRGWPYVFEVRDLWPEFPIQIGAIRNKLVIKYLRGMERKIYKNSEFVVALSPGMQDGVVAAGMPIEKTAMIPNMSKPDKFFPHEPNMEIVKQFGIDLEKFNVTYFGSMGKANGVQYIIEAARVLHEKGDDSIRFVFMGDGSTQPKIMKLAEEYGLNSVLFLGSHPMTVVSEVVNCCDLSITTFLPLPILKTNSPNKLFDSLSAGKPIAVNSAGWTKDLVEKEDCGFYVDAEKPEDLAEKLLEIKDDKALLERWGKNSRRLSLEEFDKEILSGRVADMLEKVYNDRMD